MLFIVIGAILLALFIGIPLRIIRKIIIDGDKECTEDDVAETESEPTADAILPPSKEEEGSSTADEQKNSTPKRRVSWSDKVVTDDPPPFKRPPTPVWLKDDDNVQDFWGGGDDEEVDAGDANGSHAEYDNR